MLDASNVIVLIDQHTRKTIPSIQYDSISKHCTILIDINELTDAFFGSSFVFFEYAIPDYITYELLQEYKEKYNLTCFFVTTDEQLSKLFQYEATVVNISLRSLEWNLVYSIVNNDSSVLESYRNSIVVANNYSLTFTNLQQGDKERLTNLYRSYTFLNGLLGDKIEKIASMQESMQLYKSLSNRAVSSIEEMHTLLEQVQNKCRTLEALLSKDYDTILKGVYADRPRVLYIKSISHLSGVDNLLSLLYSSLTQQYCSSCKVIRLLDHTNAQTLRYTSNNYFFSPSTYSTGDILVHDFIAKLGGTQSLFDLLMLNRTGLNYLIVHDVRSTFNCALDDALIDLKVYEMTGDYAVLAEYPNILSDVKDKSQFYWNFDEISKYTGTNSLILVNHPTVSSLLDYLI